MMAEKLTDFDRKLLYILDWDVRLHLTDIAKQLATSPQVVKYRLERLLQKQVIRRFITVTEYRRLGFVNNLLYLRLRAMPSAKERTMTEFLEGRPNINIVMRCEGRWDVAVGILARDPFDFNETLEDIHQRYGRFIDQEMIATHIGAEHYRRDYLVKPAERIGASAIPTTGMKTTQRKLSKSESAIIAAVNEDARLSLVDIAEKAGLAMESVRAGLKRLADERIVMGYTFIPDYHIYGYSFYRILLTLKYVSPKKWSEFLSFTRQHANIFHVIRAFGGYNTVLDAEVSSQPELRVLMGDLRERFGGIISDYDALLVSDVEKFCYLPTGGLGKKGLTGRLS